MNILETDSVRLDKKYMEQQLARLKYETEGIKPFADMDSPFGDIIPGMTYLIGGRPAMGKTALALNMLMHIAINQSVPAAYFSLLLTKENLINRLLARVSQVGMAYLRDREISDEDWQDVVSAVEILGDGHIILNDTHEISVEDLDRELDKEIFKGVRVVFVDDLQRLRTEIEDEITGSKARYIATKLKEIAKRRNVAIVALTGLSRELEERENRRPKIGDIINSKSVRDCFDVIITIYRDEYYDKDTETPGIAEIRVLKNRATGLCSDCEMDWLPETQTFMEVL